MKTIGVFALALFTASFAAAGCSGDDEPEIWLCEGALPACNSRTETTCEVGPGCSLKGACTGTAMSCSAIASAGQCTFQDGCFWDSFSEPQECTGTAHACSYQTAEADCDQQVGCEWQRGCTGTPVGTCTILNETQCKKFKQCSWVRKS